MEFFKPTLFIDFMKYRRLSVTLSFALSFASIGAWFYPGPTFGIDFKGGTEVEMAFKQPVSSEELRAAVEGLGYTRPDVVGVGGSDTRYIVRVMQVSALSEAQVGRIRDRLHSALGQTKVEDMKVSPGGDKISLRLSAPVELDAINHALEAAGAKVRAVVPFGRNEDHRYEATLIGTGDKLVAGLNGKLGKRAPEHPLRVEWVGPKAGAQLRDAALKSILYAMALILVYVAFRFDLRFAPGGVIALAHDAVITIGVYIVLRKEITLATVAAVLTVIGYSVTDTIVIYDRIRENMQKMRGASLSHLINVSASQTLSRTVMTSMVTMIAITGFFVWGTPVIKDLVFALYVGFAVGTYSSIFVAAPMTEWLDQRFFRKA